MSLAYPQWTRGHTVLHHRFAILRRYCHLAYPSTPRSSALQNHKSEMQNSFGPQPPNFGGWQGNGWRRTGCTPTDVNAASRQKTVVEACVPLSTEGMLYILTLLTASSISYRPFSCNIPPLSVQKPQKSTGLSHDAEPLLCFLVFISELL